MQYYFNKTLAISFDEAIDRVAEELKKEGFGILTDIDVQSTLKKNWMSASENTEYWGRVIPSFPTKPCRKRVG